MSQTIAVTEESPKKFKVKCNTCRVSQNYYTEVGVRYFKTIHADHSVVEGDASPLNKSDELVASNIIRDSSEVPVSSKGKGPLPRLRNEPKANLHVEKFVPNQNSPRSDEIRPKLEASEVVGPTLGKVAKNQGENESDQSLKDPVRPSLLLSKFSFLKEGEIYREEASRISNALKTFRWKVQPPYVIGALFDDNLSIQSSTGVISREVIMGIEQLGYYFVAVESPKGVMTAWFRKEGRQ